jgi:prepilin-type processing-associated H-X9-DG protein
VNYPASYHNHAVGIAFADGHSEIRKWLDARTMPPVRRQPQVPSPAGSPSGNSPDVFWLPDQAPVAN